LAFLSVMLRIWATSGELILAGLAYSFDLKGAFMRSLPQKESNAIRVGSPMRNTSAIPHKPVRDADPT